MTNSDPFTPGPGPAPARKLYRSRTERQIAGVCGGIAEFTNTDPTVVRVVFVVLAIVGGTGLLLYPILWFVVPEAPSHDPSTYVTPPAPPTPPTPPTPPPAP
jgi:phage shock protein C